MRKIHLKVTTKTNVWREIWKSFYWANCFLSRVYVSSYKFIDDLIRFIGNSCQTFEREKIHSSLKDQQNFLFKSDKIWNRLKFLLKIFTPINLSWSNDQLFNRWESMKLLFFRSFRSIEWTNLREKIRNNFQFVPNQSKCIK